MEGPEGKVYVHFTCTYMQDNTGSNPYLQGIIITAKPTAGVSCYYMYYMHLSLDHRLIS